MLTVRSPYSFGRDQATKLCQECNHSDCRVCSHSNQTSWGHNYDTNTNECNSFGCHQASEAPSSRFTSAVFFLIGCNHSNDEDTSCWMGGPQKYHITVPGSTPGVRYAYVIYHILITYFRNLITRLPIKAWFI